MVLDITETTSRNGQVVFLFGLKLVLHNTTCIHLEAATQKKLGKVWRARFSFPGLELACIQQFFTVGYGFFTLAGDFLLHYAKNVQIIPFHESKYLALQIR
ncbi:hypothetical protein YSY22_29100 [Brevibacillus formosus]